MTVATAELEVEGSAPIALYRLYSADGTLLWVGITHSLSDRFAQHAADKPWWPEVARKTAAWCPSRDAAAHAEAAAVRDEQPLYNIRLHPLPEVPVEPRRPRTNAEHQRAHRQRQASRMAGLEQANTALHAQLAIMRQRAESAESALIAANEEISRLAGLACKHPAAAVNNGRCLACGSDVW